MNKSYFLVTNSNELTWKKNVNIVLLGNWCYNFYQLNVYKNYNYVVSESYGIELNTKKENYSLQIKLKTLLIDKISIHLNNYHNINQDKRFWKIVLGNWIERYISIIINRYNTIKECVATYDISGSIFFINESFDFVPKESGAIIFESNSDKFNSFIYQKILEHLQVENFTYEFIPYQFNKPEFQKTNTSSTIYIKRKYSLLSIKRLFINKFYGRIIKLLSKIKDNNAPFIIRPYLPFLETFNLHVLFGAIPREWESPKIEITNVVDYKYRNKLKSELSNSITDNFEQFLYSFLPELLPMCFLENFKEYQSNLHTKTWPSNPKFIFTSNCFDTDEVFKIWAAKKIAQGVPFYIGQHGNNYGTYRYMCPSNEEEVADKFITWGWNRENGKYFSSFIFKTINTPKIYDKNGYLLLIENPMPNNVYTWDIHHEFKIYWDEQTSFVEKLPLEIKNKLIIRLHQEFRLHNWLEINRWHEIDSSLKIDAGKTPLNHLISNSRLVIHSYDSTGILETLSMNIPTMAFWQGGYDHLNEESIKFYEILKDAGIIYFNHNEISEKVIEIWDNVDEWWSNEKVQTARKLFCNEYARVIDKPLNKLKQILEN